MSRPCQRGWKMCFRSSQRRRLTRPKEKRLRTLLGTSDQMKMGSKCSWMPSIELQVKVRSQDKMLGYSMQMDTTNTDLHNRSSKTEGWRLRMALRISRLLELTIVSLTREAREWQQQHQRLTKGCIQIKVKETQCRSLSHWSRTTLLRMRRGGSAKLETSLRGFKTTITTNISMRTTESCWSFRRILWTSSFLRKKLRRTLSDRSSSLTWKS